MSGGEPSKPTESLPDAAAPAASEPAPAAAGEGLGGDDIWGDGEEDDLPAEILELSDEQIRQRVRMLDVRRHCGNRPNASGAGQHALLLHRATFAS